MTDRSYYADAAADSGGSGATKNLSSGDGSHACDSVENAKAQAISDGSDLVTLDDTVTIRLCNQTGTAIDPTPLNSNGFTTSATNNVLYTLDDPSAPYLMTVADPANGYVCRIHDQYTVVEGIWATLDTADANTYAVFSATYTNLTGSKFRNCKAILGNTTGATGGRKVGFVAEEIGTDVTFIYENCEAVNFTSASGYTGHGWRLRANCNVYYSTAYNCDYGFNRSIGTVNWYGCGAASCTTPFNGGTQDSYCSSSSPTFVDAPDDLTLDSADTVWLVQGESGGPASADFTDDASFTERPAIWSIGAREAAGAASRSLDSVTGTIAPGESITINCTGLDAAPTTQTVTLGGQALTVTSWNAGNPICTIPTGVSLQWGIATYTLSVTDDTGTVDLINQTLSARSGWSYKDYIGPAPGASEEGFVKAALDDLSIIMEIAADQVQYTTTSDMTVGDDLVITIIPPATKTGTYAVWDNSTTTRSTESTFTFAEQPVLTNPLLTSTGQTTMTLSVDTDVNTGTLYWYLSTSATPPSVADLKSGTGAADFGSIAVSVSGTQNDSATGLVAATTYYLHALHTNTVDSDTVTSSGVATDGTGADVTPDQFTFTDITDAAVSTQYQDTQSITGVDEGETLNVTNGELSNNGGTNWSSSVTMVAGQTLVRATVTSSANRGTAASQSPVVNGVSDTFTVTTFANTAPVFSGTVADRNHVRNTAFNLDLTIYFSDADSDTLTYSLQAGTLPSGITLVDGVLSGIPDTIENQSGIIIRAADGFGGTADTNAFSVNIIDTQPTDNSSYSVIISAISSVIKPATF